MSLVFGFDPGLKQHTRALLWILSLVTTEWPVPPSFPMPQPDLIVVEWPSAQGYERVYARLLERSVALVDELRARWPDVPIYGVPSNVLRFKICGWAARNGGRADKAVGTWLRAHGFAEYLKRGGELNSPDKRDALVAALWGAAVLDGKIEQPERWLL